MLTPKTETLYAVARGTTILSDGYATPDFADMQLKHLSETMTAVGLEPDLHLVTVEVETTLGEPKLYPPAPVTIEGGLTVTEATPLPVPAKRAEK